MSVDYHATHFFLTYPQTDIPLDSLTILIPDLCESLTSVPLKHFTCCVEKHEDGSPHIHIVLSFQRQLRVRNCTFFDVIDTTGRLRHPNIQTPSGNSKHWVLTKVEYCKKDGEFFTTHPEPITKRPKWDIINETIDSATSEHAVLSLVRQHSPRDAFLFGSNIIDNWHKICQKPNVFTPRSMDEFTLPDALREWYDEHFQVRLRRPFP